METKTKDYEFEVKSGRINITDPCYSDDTWCAIFRQSARSGRWVVGVETDGDGRISRMRARHEKTSEGAFDGAIPLGMIGVDSGQAGVFDSEVYPKGMSTGEYDNKESFYGRCCELTLGDDGCGVVEGAGIVTCTGWGDGNYPVSGVLDGGELVCIEITYIAHEDEDEG